MARNGNRSLWVFLKFGTPLGGWLVSSWSPFSSIQKGFDSCFEAEHVLHRDQQISRNPQHQLELVVCQPVFMGLHHPNWWEIDSVHPHVPPPEGNQLNEFRVRSLTHPRPKPTALRPGFWVHLFFLGWRHKPWQDNTSNIKITTNPPRVQPARRIRPVLRSSLGGFLGFATRDGTPRTAKKSSVMVPVKSASAVKRAHLGPPTKKSSETWPKTQGVTSFIEVLCACVFLVCYFTVLMKQQKQKRRTTKKNEGLATLAVARR